MKLRIFKSLPFFAFTLFIVAFMPAIKILVTKWATLEQYMHAFFVLPIIGYMVWSKRHCIRVTNLEFNLLGFLLAIFSSSFYLFSLLTRVHTLILLSMLFSVFGVMIFLCGIKSLYKFATPLILFAVLIPVPEQLYIQLTSPLQIWVSQASEHLLHFLSIPLFREGNIMMLPQKKFEVVEACSGLRSIIALISLSIVIGYFVLNKVRTKIALVVVSIPIAIIVNIVRVSAMIMLYYYLRLDLSSGARHTTYGLAVFSISLILFFCFIRILRLWERKIK